MTYHQHLARGKAKASAAIIATTCDIYLVARVQELKRRKAENAGYRVQ